MLAQLSGSGTSPSTTPLHNAAAPLGKVTSGLVNECVVNSVVRFSCGKLVVVRCAVDSVVVLRYCTDASVLGIIVLLRDVEIFAVVSSVGMVLLVITASFSAKIQ